MRGYKKHNLPRELFDLQKDPDEMNNLYSRPDSQQLVRQLKTELEALKKRYAVPAS